MKTAETAPSTTPVVLLRAFGCVVAAILLTIGLSGLFLMLSAADLRDRSFAIWTFSSLAGGLAIAWFSVRKPPIDTWLSAQVALVVVMTSSLWIWLSTWHLKLM